MNYIKSISQYLGESAPISRALESAVSKKQFSALYSSAADILNTLDAKGFDMTEINGYLTAVIGDVLRGVDLHKTNTKS